MSTKVLPLFKDTAQEFIKKCNGDAEKALCYALAYMSGHYKGTMTGRSLLSGQERHTTVEIRQDDTAGGPSWKNSSQQVRSILQKYWPPQMVDYIKGMRVKKDGMGVVFDMYED